MPPFAFLALAFLATLPLSFSALPLPPFVYNISAGPVPDKLNVHLVPHTHDDVGWLKTVDQYYAGTNNSIQKAAVHLILDTVIAALQDDPNRKFVYVEQAFFQRWWREQTPKKQAIVKSLVDAGQLEFINGGWCMHDEATTHYIDMIDQTTLGHRYIKQQFGKVPRIGWQIDPFGHSAVQAYLLSAEMGFDALYFARIDYQDKLKRLNKSSLEMVWQGSKTLGSSAQIFTGVFFDFYGPPTGFDFDIDSTDTPFQDNPLLFDYNVQDRVDAFVSTAQMQASSIRTNHIMWTMGSDFNYQNAHGWYTEMDRFINWVNQDGRVNTFYSTPSLYTDAKYAANETWPLKLGDFFPYADCAHCYWTGYFTSRPALKGYVRMLSSYYLFARQLEVLVGRKSSGPNTDLLAEAMAICQHHDAVSGTEKQHTANDYAKRLSIGSSEAIILVNEALSCLVGTAKTNTCGNTTTVFEQCPLLNLSYCPSAESNFQTGKSLVVVAYNALGWNQTDYIRIPVNSKSIQVTDSGGNVIPSQLLPVSNITKKLRHYYVQAYLGVSSGNPPLYWLVFPVIVPAFGYSSYVVSASNETGSAALSVAEETSKNETKTIGSDKLELRFSGATGHLSEIINTQTKANASIQQAYLFYGGNNGADEQGTDGAYIFRPVSDSPTDVNNSSVPITVLKGPLVQEVWQEFSPWIHQVTRLYKDKDYAEIEFVIGAIPIEDAVGKDVISRLTTNVESADVFYTDSNGRDFIKRVRDYRADWDLQVNEPVAGNYYPVNLGMFIKDNNTEFSLLVDRAMGGSSINSGQLELMLHRRLLHDDGRGVGEALNETVCLDSNCEGLTVQGKYFMSIHLVNEGSRWRRLTGQQVYSPLRLAFSSQDEGENWISSHISSSSSMVSGYNLPENVALITLQELDGGNVLLRLAHLYEMDEDVSLSTKAYVDLSKLFASRKITNATELSLSANQEKSAIKPRYIWNVKDSDNESKHPIRGGPIDPTNLRVELGPMEIRTFLLNFAQLSDL